MRGQRLFFPDQRRVEVETFEFSEEPGPGEMVLENHLSLISPGTELALYTKSHVGFSTGISWVKYPFRPGYASVGRVLRIGAELARSSGIKEGDWVTSRATHASHAVVDSATKIPEGVDPEMAVFSYLCEIALTSVYASDVRIGMDVAVVGQGLIGNFAAQLMQAAGAMRVIGIDPVASRLSIARECGIELLLNPKEVDQVAHVKELTKGAGCHVVVEATGVPEVASHALKLVRKQGKLILLGSPRGSTSIDLYGGIHSPGVSVVGAHVNHLTSFAYLGAPSSAEVVLGFMAKGKIKTTPFVSHRMKAREAGAAYEGLSSNPAEYLGVILDLREW